MNYDDFYRHQPAYFGKPFPELIDYFRTQDKKGKVLDVGCGQGRNAVPLGEMGYQVHGIDTSAVAISQLGARVEYKNLQVKQKDFFELDNLQEYDSILLDGFFHFNDHDRMREESCVKKIRAEAKSGCAVICCFADKENSKSSFEKMMEGCKISIVQNISYSHVDPVSEWEFETRYWLFVFTVV